MKKTVFFRIFLLVSLFGIKANSQNDTLPVLSNFPLKDSIQTKANDSLPSLLDYANNFNSLDSLPSLNNSRIYNPERDPKRLLYNTGLYAGTAVISFGLLWIAPVSVSKWDKDEIKDEGLTKKWKSNVQSGPVFDQDDFVMNYIIHPWAGGVYYMSARGSGYEKWESFTYSVLMSTLFWEYGIEAFAEVPSWQDLIVTPIAGSIAGELFFVAKGKIIQNDRRILKSKALGNTTLFIMDPFNELLDILGYKTKNKIEGYSSFLPMQANPFSRQQTWGVQVVLKF